MKTTATGWLWKRNNELPTPSLQFYGILECVAGNIPALLFWTWTATPYQTSLYYVLNHCLIEEMPIVSISFVE
jgi:hypothetical protein